MIQTVLKVGGSLGQSPNLPDLLAEIVDLAPRHGLLTVPGGGAFADAIRAYDRRFGIDQDASHWMAILAMDQFGYLLSSLAPRFELVTGLADARRALANGRAPVLLTYNLLHQADELPRSWEVTSDSIAAWVAHLAGARQLVLIKSVDGLWIDGPESGIEDGPSDEITLQQLVRSEGVDRYLPVFLKNGRPDNCLDTWVINGKHPERLGQLLQEGRTTGTKIR